jgi:hypothetical protein
MNFLPKILFPFGTRIVSTTQKIKLPPGTVLERQFIINNEIRTFVDRPATMKEVSDIKAKLMALVSVQKPNQH